MLKYYLWKYYTEESFLVLHYRNEKVNKLKILSLESYNLQEQIIITVY